MSPILWVAGLVLAVLMFLAVCGWGRRRDEAVRRMRAMRHADDPPERRYERDAALPDRPVVFGPGMRWLALPAGDTDQAALVLGLERTYRVNWAHGIERCARFRRRKVFVTPPIGPWVFIVSAGAVASPDSPAGRDLLASLSRAFGAALFFAADDWRGMRGFGLARGGSVERLSLTGAGGEAEEGSALPEEAGDDAFPFDVAGALSIDPRALEAHGAHTPLATGLVGDLPDAWASES